MKKNILTVFLSLSMVFITSCGNNIAKEALEQGESALQEKQYDKALSAFNIVLDNDKENKKAMDFRNLIEDYQMAQDKFEDDFPEQANTIIKNIEFDYSKYVINDDIEELKTQINNKIELNDTFDRNITKLNTSCDEKNFEDCNEIIETLKTHDLDLEQEQVLENMEVEINELKDIQNKEIEEKQKKEQEQVKVVEKKQKETEKTENKSGKSQEEAKNILISWGGFIPESIFSSESDNKTFRGDLYYHFSIPTSGDQFFVNSQTGEVIDESTEAFMFIESEVVNPC